MNELFRFSPSRLALSYAALTALVLALFAIPLWYAWSVNLSTFKEYVRADDIQRMTDILDRDGASRLAAAIESQQATYSPDQVVVLADSSKTRVAGNLPAWPEEVPDAPGTYGLVIKRADSPMRIVGTHVTLPGGYHLLLGRESARFQSLVDYFWSGIAAATVIGLLLGGAIAWFLRRGLLGEVRDISRNATAIIEGNLSHRLPVRRRSDALSTLTQTVNGMLEQLAEQNSRLAAEVAERRKAERALQRAHDHLEEVVAQRTAALQRSEERYALAMEASGEGHWDWNIATDEYYVSPQLLETYGFPPGTTFRGRADFLSQFPLHPDDRTRLEEAIAAHFAGETARGDIEVRIIRHGETRWIHLTGLLSRSESGEPLRWAGAVTDITAKKSVDEELERMDRQLRQAQRLEAVGTLAGGIAHDFNNLLGAILGYGEMALRDAPAGSRLRRDIESIMVAGERGRALVDRILAFSRSSVGERVPVHVEEVVRETLALFAAHLPEGIALDERLDAPRAAVLGDATQIHQVMMNLMTNGVQAMPRGGTLRVSLTRSSVSAARVATTGTLTARDHVVLEIADSGSGMAPEVLEKIFDPFFTTKKVGVGTGLGLSLVHGIVTGLGGAIDVATAVGKGTVFTVYLPRTGDILAGSDPKPRAEPRRQRGREHILVVDDEEALVRLTAARLAELGYTTASFTVSSAALDAFVADPSRFDAVITDESMPGTSGSELTTKIRRIRPSIPILLISGYLSPDVIRRAKAAGATDVLKKPISADQLAAALDRALHSASAV